MWRIIIQVSGALIFIAGMIFFLLPIPIGAVMMIIGLTMMISSSKKLRRVIREYRRRNPKLNSTIHGAEFYLPKSMRDSIDRTDPDRYAADEDD